MLVAAFRYTGAWQAVTPVVASLAAVILTLWSTRRSERERAQEAAATRAVDREHERALREVELRATRQSRLHDDRIAAYRAFLLHVLERARLRRKTIEAGLRLELAKSGGDPSSIEEQGSRLRSAKSAFREATEATREVLVSVELVASHPVRVAVSSLLEAMEKAENPPSLNHPQELPADDPWELAQRVMKLQTELRDAIGEELGLDK